MNNRFNDPKGKVLWNPVKELKDLIRFINTLVTNSHVESGEGIERSTRPVHSIQLPAHRGIR